MHGGVVVVLLVATAILAMIAIEFTYTSTYAKHVPSKKSRMYARGLAYSLLTCVGILLVVVVYALATESLRQTCRMAKAAALPPERAARVGDPGPTSV
jgi:hypothetical protein